MGERDSGPSRWARLRGPAGQRLCLAAILIGMAVALAAEAWLVGVTVDEPAHVLSSDLYWHGADRLRPRDMPPLIKLAGGWVPALMGVPIPRDHPSWKEQHEWTISMAMVERLGARVPAVFFLCRLPLIVFPLLTAWLLWRWGRELFGGWPAVMLALLCALEPTLIGHGAIYKNDVAATFGYLAFWYAAWKYWREPRASRAAWFGAGVLAAVLAKMSMLFLAGAAPLIVLLRFVTRRAIGWRTAAAALALVLLIPYLGTLAAYQFETRRLSGAELEALGRDPSLPRPFLLASQIFRVVPIADPMWRGGVSLVHSNAGGNQIYLFGDVHAGGHRLYFPFALLVKVPMPIQLLGLAGAALLAVSFARRKPVPGLQRRIEAADLFWLLPPVIYIGLASFSSLQLGVRLILPGLPFGMLVCGVAVAWLGRGRRAWVLAALIAFLAIQTARNYPHGISFFNFWVGGPEYGLRYLADSNLDWGQDLRELARWQKQHQVAKIKLSYFGNDAPWAYFTDSEIELIPPPWGDELTHGRTRLEPEPGYYAISATLLPGHFFDPKYRRYYARFRQMHPIDTAGYSILIYRVE